MEEELGIKMAPSLAKSALECMRDDIKNKMLSAREQRDMASNEVKLKQAALDTWGAAFEIVEKRIKEMQQR